MVTSLGARFYSYIARASTWAVLERPPPVNVPVPLPGSWIDGDGTAVFGDEEVAKANSSRRRPCRLGGCEDLEDQRAPDVAVSRQACPVGTAIGMQTRQRVPKTPVRVVYKSGFVTEVSGGEEAEGLLQVIRRGEEMAREADKKEEERNARALGELGIGINPAAKMTCNMLEDEKVGKTVHFAIGMNLDGDGHAFIHQDCLVKSPNVWVDGKMIMSDGDIVI